MKRFFGTDGVRGVAGEGLTCELAMAIGQAVAGVLSGSQSLRPRVLIGCDTRLSSRMLVAALAAGLCSVGADVIDGGVLPTPAVAYLTQAYGAVAGISVSASHNSFEYNGIKIFNKDGFKLADELEEEIEATVASGGAFPAATGTGIGRITVAENAALDYVSYLSSTVTEELSGYTVAIDCANGAAAAIAERLFTGFGVRCHMLSCQPNGENINDRCGSTHLSALAEYVKGHPVDAGFAFDGDADRLLCVDENGNEADGDFLLAALALDKRARGCLRHNALVGTVMSNLGLVKLCEREGIRFVAERVGDRHVLECMEREGYTLGGEQSGHIILREYATTGDGALCALQILSLMKRTGKGLGELVSVMKKYPQYAVNVPAGDAEKIAFFTDPEIQSILKAAERKLEGRGRILVRPSGTEPCVRVMAESETEEETRRIAVDTAEKIAARLKKKEEE